MPTSEQVNEFKIKLSYGHQDFAKDLRRKLFIYGDRDLECEKIKLSLLTALKDGIFRYFENWDTDSTSALTIVEVDNMIEHFNRIVDTNYYIKLN